MVTVFQCEDSVDGIFTGIYEAWASRLGHGRVKVETEGERNLELFSTYIKVDTDRVKAGKVADTIRRRLSEEGALHIFQAAQSCDPDRADEIYRVLVMGLSQNGGRVMEQLQNPHVCRVFEMSRRVGNEAHRYLQFLRFRELKNGVLFAKIHPENQVLSLIGDHFSDRFPGEHFLIHDASHHLFLIHRAKTPWFLADSEGWNEKAAAEFSRQEEEMQQLWQVFFDSIAIRERKNLNLQRQFLPLKFRAYMTEKFDSEEEKQEKISGR